MGEPSFLDKVNFVIHFWMDPCDAPLQVYAETLWPAFMELLVDYLEFQPSEASVQAFRDSYRVPRKKTRKKSRGGLKSGKKSWVRRAGRVLNFDASEELGHKIQGWGKPTAKVLRGLKGTLWIIEGLLERLSWWLYLLSLLIDFLYNWGTNVIEVGYCAAQEDDVLYATGDNHAITGIMGWFALLMPYIEKQRGSVTWYFSSGSFGGNAGTVVIGFDYQNGPDYGPTQVGLRATVDVGLASQRIEETVIQVPRNGSGSISLMFDIPHNSSFVVEHAVNNGYGTVIEPSITMFGENNSGRETHA